MRPWFHESTTAALFNEWTWTHFAWGLASAAFVRGHLAAIALHTGYEAIEGRIFPDPHRDVSIRNHVGDSIAFLAGRASAILLRGR